jgi:ribosomal protein S18 acetylase RimI-like enzyme
MCGWSGKRGGQVTEMRGIDQWRARLGWAAESDENPDIEPLTPAAARALRLPWLSRFSPQTLNQHLSMYPGMAYYVPVTGEYVIAEPWRRRDDIAQIIEVTARKGKGALLRRLGSDLHSSGVRLLMLAEEVWRDNPRSFTDLGFDKLQSIVFFEKSLSFEGLRELQNTAFPALDYRRTGVRDLDLLLELDHNSFPWLWWNSREEFEFYVQMPDVSVYVASDAGEPVGYASFTYYPGWAHLDRLAVIEGQQGKRYGAAQLLHALTLMTEAGKHDVGLSTQATNVKSHRLYKGFGFHLGSDAMKLYGIKLDPEVEIA